MTASETDLADLPRLLPGEVVQRATALLTAVDQAGTLEDALLACDNLTADLNEPDTIRVYRCLVVRLRHGDLAGDAVTWMGKAAPIVIDAQPLEQEGTGP